MSFYKGELNITPSQKQQKLKPKCSCISILASCNERNKKKTKKRKINYRAERPTFIHPNHFIKRNF
jgi:hypothetical protein